MDDEVKPEMELSLLEQPQHREDPILGRTDPAPPKQTVVFLDGLRGLAALLVYLSHNVSWYYNPDDPMQKGYGYHDGSRMFATLPFVRIFFTGGGAAVSIFFVLSGFVLSRSPLRMLRDGIKPYNVLLSSTIRRPVRLYTPPIVISLIVAFCLHTPIAPLLSWPPTQPNIILEIWNWLKELLYALNPFIEHAPYTAWFPYNPPIWTMTYEYKGSILVFFLLALSTPLPTERARMLLFGACGVILLLTGTWAMACFMAGVVLAMTDVEDRARFASTLDRNKNIMLHAIFFAGWYLLSQVGGGEHNPEVSYGVYGWYYLTKATPKIYSNKEYWRFWQSIGAVMVVFAILRIRWLQHRLTSLKYLGKVSFSLYLLHTPILWIVSDRLFRFFTHRRPEAEIDSWFDNRVDVPDVGPRGLTTKFLLCQAALLSFIMVLSHYSTIYIDDPSMRLSKWFSTKVMAAMGRSER
ncbi:membrane protein acetyltransferase-like protein [Myriangium duriaei CBS 260.36]|uniref:Membrane protein acetyltransferase-like protein n=1 Tax=Myriangium duriaei CBS 260.36 TaxID=1168546 RepID=A0A9P4MEG1_9PEZI|nr:membrane protein acetyltransferase-like protein [Myriangium duriaei CBS 260.36]